MILYYPYINDIKFDSNKFYHENSRLIDSFDEDEVLSKYYDEYYNINRPYAMLSQNYVYTFNINCIKTI